MVRAYTNLAGIKSFVVFRAVLLKIEVLWDVMVSLGE